MSSATFHREVPKVPGLYLATREPCNGERGAKILATVFDNGRTWPLDLTPYDWFFGPLPTEMPKEEGPATSKAEYVAAHRAAVETLRERLEEAENDLADAEAFGIPSHAVGEID